MAHISDFTQSEDKIVLDLINEENGTSFSLSELTISNPEVVGGPNVRVTLTPMQGTGYGGNQVVNYRRLGIQEFMDLFYPGGFTLPLGDAVNTLDFIDEINAGLGISLTESQVVSIDIGEWEGIPNETKNVNFVIAANSKVYHGVAIITVDGNDIPLENVLASSVLEGLNLPYIEPPINLQPLIDQMVYPFEANIDMSPEFVIGELSKYLGVAPSDISFSSGAEFPGLFNPETTVDLISNNPGYAFNGSNTTTVTLGLGRYLIANDQLQSRISNGNLWTWDSVHGWYNDVSQPDGDSSTISGLETLFGRLKSVGGTFTSYPMSNGNGLGSNFLMVGQGGTHQKVGTWDQHNGDIGTYVYNNGIESYVTGDIVEKTYRVALPPPSERQPVNELRASSACRNGFNKTIRGMKDIFIELYVTRHSVATVTSKYFRLFIDTLQPVNDGIAELKDFYLYDEYDNNVLLLNNVLLASASTRYYDDRYGPMNLIEGYNVNEASENKWASESGNGLNSWVSFELIVPVSVKGFGIKVVESGGSVGKGRSPQNFKFQTSEDGVDWVTVKEFGPENNWGAEETRVFTVE